MINLHVDANIVRYMYVWITSWINMWIYLYETLAKDAERSGNIVLAENYRQHLEHYQRIINSFEEQNPPVEKKEPQPQAQNQKTDDVEDLGLPVSMVAEAKIESDVVTA